jgi:hypothetical protein
MIMFSLILITVGLHRPNFSSSTVIIVIFTACLWVLDRIIRGVRLAWNFFGNSATVTALPNDALRMRLKRRMCSSPGSHGFLWVPAIRWVESHPFTLLSSSPPEFVIRVYDGFTRDLYKAAKQAPGRSLRCSVDGPYGQVPNFKSFDKVILIAGGSGASFTFSIALDLIESPASTVKSIDFIWVVRQQGKLGCDLTVRSPRNKKLIAYFIESLEWYAQELEQLQAHPELNVHIYVTRPACSSELSSPVSSGAQSEKGSVISEPIEAEPPSAIITNDIEKGALKPSPVEISAFSLVRPGRPDIDNLIEAIVDSSSSAHDRVIIGACGPSELMSVTRKAVHKDRYNGGLSMTLYTEVSLLRGI